MYTFHKKKNKLIILLLLEFFTLIIPKFRTASYIFHIVKFLLSFIIIIRRRKNVYLRTFFVKFVNKYVYAMFNMKIQKIAV